ncbi:MAG TPA: HNH endonuclease signature motif containing protein [Flavobacterium sp.]|nr:HNH endonuclease signature motif containing protein [Flavobacterium sp.]
MTTRIPIPSELKRKILVESGHRCSIPTCRFPTTEVAHIVPYSETKKHEYDNLIALCPNCHTRFDKGEIDKKSMRVYKKKLVFLSERYSRFELNVLDYLRAKGKVTIAGPLTVKNLLDEGLIKNVNTMSYITYNDGEQEVSDFIAVLTSEGLEFIDNWTDAESPELMY